MSPTNHTENKYIAYSMHVLCLQYSGTTLEIVKGIEYDGVKLVN
jgi:hypothetical protein